MGENQDRRVDHSQLVFRVRQFPPQSLRWSSLFFLADSCSTSPPLSVLGGDDLMAANCLLLRGIYVHWNFSGNAGCVHLWSAAFASDGPLDDFNFIEQGFHVIHSAERIGRLK